MTLLAPDPPTNIALTETLLPPFPTGSPACSTRVVIGVVLGIRRVPYDLRKRNRDVARITVYVAKAAY